MGTPFSAWLKNELDKRGWNQAELSRRSHRDPATISNLVNGKRLPGEELCSAIADALEISPEIVFRAAGLLPSTVDEYDDIVAQILGQMEYLRPIDKEEVLEFIRMRRMLSDRHVDPEANSPRV